MKVNHTIVRNPFKGFVLLLFMIFVYGHSCAQYKISGIVSDSSAVQVLPQASVILQPGNHIKRSQKTGSFEFNNLPAGNYKLSISYVGYETYNEEIDLKEDKIIKVNLSKKIMVYEEVNIQSTRAAKDEAIAFSDIDKITIKKNNLAQDLPYLLDQTPSLVTTSDAGAGVGYTGVRIRGSDASRINVTLNNVPLNDAESQNMYFVDLPDLASSVENIQVQRGIGTSTNGAGAFGGSINIMTNKLSSLPYFSSSNAFGSFNTIKNNISLGTGLINNHWGFEGRLSRIKSDGYIDRASSDLKSYYLSGGYFSKRAWVKFTLLSGLETTYQAWNGVPENLLDENRTYNVFTYENQVDHYGQDHYQLLAGYDLTDKLSFQVTLHDTKGKGYYEEFKKADDYFGEGTFAFYGLPDLQIGSDTIRSTDLVRRKWLDNNFYGLTYSLTYNPFSHLKLILGGAWNQYDGDHFSEITWARFSGNINTGYRYENDNALKTDFNIYVKCYYELLSRFVLTSDIQTRKVNYRFTGLDELVQPAPQEENLLFFNPKFGLTWIISPGINLYTSAGRGAKEPSRDDFTTSSAGNHPKAEKMTDIEAGFRLAKKKISASLNFYHMQYQNQLVLTGKVNDVGNYTRVNVPHSFRKGLEIEFKYEPVSMISVGGNATFSRNIISSFDEYIDNYDDNSQLKVNHKRTSLAYSPVFTACGVLSVNPLKNLSAGIIARHVGKQYLDNTTDNNRKISDYTVCDIRLGYVLTWKKLKEIQFSLTAGNIFSKKYVSNGYTFSYISGGTFSTENYYYPQALVNFMGQVNITF